LELHYNTVYTTINGDNFHVDLLLEVEESNRAQSSNKEANLTFEKKIFVAKQKKAKVFVIN